MTLLLPNSSLCFSIFVFFLTRFNTHICYERRFLFASYLMILRAAGVHYPRGLFLFLSWIYSNVAHMVWKLNDVPGFCLDSVRSISCKNPFAVLSSSGVQLWYLSPPVCILHVHGASNCVYIPLILAQYFQLCMTSKDAKSSQTELRIMAWL